MRGVAISGLVIAGLLHSGVSQAGNVKLAKAAAAQQAAPRASSEEIHKAFEVFCAEWMQKLAAREHDNVAHITWNTSADGVEGEYVGYTKEDLTCVVKDGGTAPVGQMTYFEVRYTKRGRTVEEARQSAAEPVEKTSVTELFGYAKNKWVY